MTPSPLSQEAVDALVAETQAHIGKWHGWMADANPEADRFFRLALRLATALESVSANYAPRAVTVEECAKVADAEERECEALRNERPRDSYHWSFWERARKSASTIAAAIRALTSKETPPHER